MKPTVDRKMWKGVAIGIPISTALWVVIILAALAVSGCSMTPEQRSRLSEALSRTAGAYNSQARQPVRQPLTCRTFGNTTTCY